jgi:hypothetical protein
MAGKNRPMLLIVNSLFSLFRPCNPFDSFLAARRASFL